MNPNPDPVSFPRSAARRDLIGISLLWTATFVLALTLDVSEAFKDVLSRPDGWKVGGMFLVFLVLALSLGLFSARRWRELAAETEARKKVEEGLRQAIGLLQRRVKEEEALVSGSTERLLTETHQRVRVEEALRLSEEKFRDFVENAGDLVQIVSGEGRFLYVNRAWKQSLGYDDVEVASLTIQDVIDPSHRDLCSVVFQRVMRGERVDRVEAIFVAKDGRRVILEGNVNAQFEGGKFLSCRGVFRDVTERRASERRRAAQHAVARILAGANSLQEAAPRLLEVLGGCLEWEGGILWAAERGEGLRPLASWGAPGIPPPVPAAGGSGVAGRVLRFGAPCWVRDLREEEPAAAAGGFRSELAFPVLVGGEVAAVVDLFSREVREADVGMLGVGTSLADQMSQFITRVRAEEAMKAAKNAAEAANRAKSRFLAYMSHELRTPLNSVIGFAGVLLKNRSGSLQEKELTYLERIRENGKHLLRLINGILDLAKIEAGKEELRLEPVGLGDLVGTTLAELEGQVAGRPIRLEADIPEGLRPLVADAGKLKQVLINLVGNAIKFTEKGRVVVRVLAEGARPLQIEVEDTGIGIPEGHQQVIFDAFRQGDESIRRRYGGTGLGLVICRSLCRLLGYRITFESEVGKGTVFRVHLAEGDRMAPEEVARQEAAACST